MPPKLPNLSGKEIVRRFEKLGFVSVRQKGSHIESIGSDTIDNWTLHPMAKYINRV